MKLTPLFAAAFIALPAAAGAQTRPVQSAADFCIERVLSADAIKKFGKNNGGAIDARRAIAQCRKQTGTQPSVYKSTAYAQRGLDSFIIQPRPFK